jgi:hypothetical protein
VTREWRCLHGDRAMSNRITEIGGYGRCTAMRSV